MAKPKTPQFVSSLLLWFEQSHRPMPWKGIEDPYLIWLSEVILQQTRVNQGWDYYIRFKDRFPNIESLATASIEEVLKHWEGLGYYTRARNLHASAQIIMEKHNGIFPDNYEEILALKGVGKYTAAAISSFAFAQAYAVVDGNVYRVLSRLLDNHTPTDSLEGKKLFEQIANEYIKFASEPGIYNQAIMDFGATVCKPSNPLCNICPMVSYCQAFKNNTVNILPIKSKKLVRKNRYFHYYIIQQEGKVYIQQRMHKDIWHLLFQFPYIETENELEPDKSVIFIDSKSIIKYTSDKKLYKQTLTHQNITAKFYNLSVNTNWEAPRDKSWRKIDYKNIGNFVFPRIINEYLELQLIEANN
ncbi:MAG TPA: A/G-specific adenine glycosylase [Saprospiraceae bacterium]|nr:A/G-specific adenine glycosylase [Saprospiraceae bacterium]